MSWPRRGCYPVAPPADARPAKGAPSRENLARRAWFHIRNRALQDRKAKPPAPKARTRQPAKKGRR